MYKKVLTACLALTLAVSMTACGDTDDSGKSKESKTDSSTVSQTEESKPADESKADETESAQESEADESDTAEEESQAEPADSSEAESVPAEDEKYAYYDLLDAEYQKYGKVIYGEDNSRLTIADGVMLYSDYYSHITPATYLFDEDGNVTDLIESAGFIAASQAWYYYLYNGGYIFSTNEDKNAVIMTDLKVNVIKNIEVPYARVCSVSGNGDVIVGSSGEYYIIKKDSNEPVKLPDIEAEAEHGLTETLTIGGIALNVSYKNKIYATPSDKANNYYTYYLDCNDLTWHKVGDAIPQPDLAIGKYLFFEYGQNKVYDMEKDEYTDEIPYSACLSYYGGNSSIFLEDGEWVEKQYDPEAESFVTINTIGADDSDADFAIMSRTHYAVIDDYGIFVRSFEKGKDDEKTIALFED